MIPDIKAAIFDLDGTLLDSMYVWRRVDEIFFARRGMQVPRDYGRRVAGLSYRETAELTRRVWLPDEDCAAMMEEWMRLAEEEYALRVPLKEGAAAFLRRLKRAGARLAVATAMTERLYGPCLERNGVLELFDALCSTDHTGGRGKGSGDVFLYAAERLGAPPEDCVVFEDVLAGVQGAKRAGMRVCAVRDEASRADRDAIEALADRTIDGFSELDDGSGRPRCVIYTARCEGDPAAVHAPRPDDLVLCADAGWQVARTAGVRPDLVIGDFDSSAPPADAPLQVHPVMKDDTDTLLCLREGFRRGYDDFLIVGGFGGRIDHTLANLQSMRWAAERGASVRMDDGRSTALVLHDAAAVLERREGKLSVFSMSERCEGVTIEGTLYELPAASGTLTNAYPVGVSNEFARDTALVGVERGTLLVMTVRE